jgi:DNA cross-link repair 1C protein
VFRISDLPGLRYLVEGQHGAVLHTGDFRAEPHFLESLIRNSQLKPYLASQSCVGMSRTESKTLEAIYLDTAAMFSESELLPKVSQKFPLNL